MSAISPLCRLKVQIASNLTHRSATKETKPATQQAARQKTCSTCRPLLNPKKAKRTFFMLLNHKTNTSYSSKSSNFLKRSCDVSYNNSRHIVCLRINSTLITLIYKKRQRQYPLLRCSNTKWWQKAQEKRISIQFVLVRVLVMLLLEVEVALGRCRRAAQCRSHPVLIWWVNRFSASALTQLRKLPVFIESTQILTLVIRGAIMKLL